MTGIPEPSPTEKSASLVELETRERAFFDDHYAEASGHPVGERKRFERDLRALLDYRGTKLARVLSIGCGVGTFELAMARHAESIVALDISRKAIDLAERAAAEQGVTNIEFRCQPLSELDWDEQFDGIVCLAFLHHVPDEDLDALLSRALDHLKPGGFFYSQDPNVSGMVRAVGRRVLGDRYHQYHSSDERELDPVDTRDRLMAAGFDQVRIGYIDLTLTPLHYMLSSGPGWLMHPLAWIDRVWCASPLARWASGFNTYATKAA